ncbi:MAG: HsdR family type I site-specific deoxyribonuclease, partial [Allobaculum sp.]|nr:HsdR family type I site-specific deoxyribonuclease [Allobaculum sp.]
VLEESLYRLNPNLPDEAIEEAMRKLTEFENAPLLERNRLFMDWLQNGLPVHFFDGKEENNDRVYLVDYEDVDNNSFIIANQWTIIEKSNKRPDILIFLNGLPIVVMELKSPSREETDVSEAYAQLRNYMQEIPSLFTYNAFLVISDLAISKAGTITSSEDRFMEWKSKDGSYENTSFVSYDTFFEGIFERKRLLDLIKNFILFMDGQDSKKIMAGYHQYFAVRKAIKTTEKAYEREDGKGGVFWHTQGSGKSLSMVFYAHLLQSVLESPTIVVITDRNDLDGQLFTQFSKTQDFLRQIPIQVENRHQLKELLKATKVNGIFFTTMQKFEKSDQPLSKRRNIVV